MDALSDVLRAVRLSGAFFFDVQARAPWVAETPQGKSVVGAMFPGTGSDHLICYHALLEGGCWCTLDGEEPLRLEAGDIVVLPHGDTHVLTTDLGMRQAPNMSMYRMPEEGRLPSRISVGADGSPAQFVCGFLACDSRPYNPLLTALPRVLRVQDHSSGPLGAYFRAALAESKGRMGGECMLGRISELMFVDVVRRYLESLPEDRMSWLSGLRDPYVGRALTALHEQPARDWTIESLAQVAALSRSAFAERFVQFVGHPPMQYVTNWRMQLATNYLRNGTESIASVANRVGYDSEAAFSRAFKKAVGSPPSEWREQHIRAA